MASLEIASPCPVKWSDMSSTPNPRVRACAQCKKSVFDVSAMTLDEVDELVLATAGHMCVRYFQRADGTIVLADCLVRRRAATVVANVIGGAVALAGIRAAYERVDDIVPIAGKADRALHDYRALELAGSVGVFGSGELEIAASGAPAPDPSVALPPLPVQRPAIAGVGDAMLSQLTPHLALGPVAHQAPDQAASMPPRK